MLVLLAHTGNARATRPQIQCLLGKSRSIIRAHLTPVRAQPLLELDPHCSLYRCRVCSWLDAANQLQPMRVDLVQVGIALDKWFGIQRKKEIGWTAAQTVTEETWRSDSYHGKWLVI